VSLLAKAHVSRGQGLSWLDKYRPVEARRKSIDIYYGPLAKKRLAAATSPDSPILLAASLLFRSRPSAPGACLFNDRGIL